LNWSFKVGNIFESEQEKNRVIAVVFYWRHLNVEPKWCSCAQTR